MTGETDRALQEIAEAIHSVPAAVSRGGYGRPSTRRCHTTSLRLQSTA